MIACIGLECTVRPSRDAAVVPEGPVRVVEFLPRTVFRIVGILLATAIVLEILWIARHVLTWIFIALFLALALNPAVDRLEARLKRRGLATGIVYLAALAVIVGIGFLFIPMLAPAPQRRWRAVGHDIYRTVGGYVTGNLLISLIAGGLTTIVLLIMGVPYAVALGLIVAILDLIPLAGATLAAIIVGAVAFLHSIPAGIIVIVFFVLYQQVENHILQPVVYGRTVQLSPLVVLISVLIGAELAGVLGALAAIPVAGAIQVVFVDWLRHGRAQPIPETG